MGITRKEITEVGYGKKSSDVVLASVLLRAPFAGAVQWVIYPRVVPLELGVLAID